MSGRNPTLTPFRWYTRPSERTATDTSPPLHTIGTTLKPAPTRVITEKARVCGPIDRLAVANVSSLAGAVIRTHTVELGPIVPAALVNVPLQPIEYCPPTTLIGIDALIPSTESAFEVTT